MKWMLKCSIWREGDWYVSHCKDLEIASQGETVEEAQENLEEAIRLFFEVASYTEVMEYLCRFDPGTPPEIQKQPKVRIKSTHQESQQMMCEVALDYA
ncbi:MAG: type II toxin-antitoxin system HicB family antitoxin [Caldilineaceae bacterium]|nr:type II toxin-antitoxin system HicB family antitoxin [Caldilineaceae bacterium]MDE0338779.1 type II toxin-antitoxin system HicB family antitoxin [Caldilineaceae bacterium]